ncbi:hypothetical protein PGT21_007351 [Puccinia graminis f. sp. tritici]|uniref:Uncharacterized protein n=1 Tax=Puccinia graminis f. sp. tritici TaxID=56615 RepID=A0A5B0N9Y9_PUCGR|nr:hypothetical protein PGT21_007351 [Puccinia graminis f. sp. tritici]KAA1122940.1 hypothetical protein PGTUg99_004511 [Puccinia graminis f. sp. tritici]
MIFNLWGHLGISPASPSANPILDHSDIDPVILAHLGFKDVAATVNGDIKPIGHCESVNMLPTTTKLEKVEDRQNWLDTERQKREEQIQNWYDELCVLWTRLGVPEDEQEQFVESWRGLSKQCVERYEAELNSLFLFLPHSEYIFQILCIALFHPTIHPCIYTYICVSSHPSLSNFF